MHKKLLAIVITVTIVFIFTACGDASLVKDSIKHTVAQSIKGSIYVEARKTHRTEWFQFTIESIERIDHYAGYSPAEGCQFIDVLITQKGIFNDSEPIPMGTFDFYMDSSIFEECIYPIKPFDDAMMPEEFDLAYDQTVVYHMIYEIPVIVPDLRLMYTEWFKDNREGATFIVDINLNEL